MRNKLTPKFVSGLEFRSKPFIVWDTDLPSFGVRVWQNGRAFIVQYKVKGKAKRKTLGNVDVVTLQAAREKAREIKAQRALGHDPIGEEREQRNEWTLEDALGHFLTDYAQRRQLDNNYKRSSKSLAKNHFSRRWLKRPIKSFTREEIARKHAKMRATPRNANSLLQLLSRLFTLAIERGERSDNPVKGIKKFTETKRDRYFTAREITALWKHLEASKNVQAATCAMLIILTGCRPGEAYKAKWSDIDLVAGVWHKPAPNTKQRKKHTVQLTAKAQGVLGRLDTKTYSKFVFPMTNDPKKPRKGIRKFWNALRKSLAMPDIRVYDLRHTFASHLAMQGAGLFEIQNLMGHASITTTQRYVHLTDKRQRAAAELMTKLIPEDTDRDQYAFQVRKKGKRVSLSNIYVEPSLEFEDDA